MNPTRYHQHQERTYHRSYDNWPELRLNHIEVKHQRHPGRHKEETQIGNQEIRKALHPIQFHPPHLQEKGKQQHTDDTGWKLHSRYGNQKFTQGQTPE